MTAYEEYRTALFSETDDKYDAFNSPIVNCEYRTVGVRTPVIKKLAKSVPLDIRDEVLCGFYADGDITYETVLFAALVAAKKGDYEKTRDHLKRIIPMFASWAHVDVLCGELKWVDKRKFLADFDYLIGCEGQYEKRTYIIFMLSACMSDDLIDFVLEKLQTVECGAYYVDMAVAWLLCEGLIKYYDKTLPLIAGEVFPPFVHIKAIQKARESFRISYEKKAYLNTLKVKSKK